MYKSRLLIYDAGDTRTTWVSFWKAMALLQFGTTLVFAVPPLWNNENQPDPNLRKAQAILGKNFSSHVHLSPTFCIPAMCAISNCPLHPRFLPFYIFLSFRLCSFTSSFHLTPRSDTQPCYPRWSFSHPPIRLLENGIYGRLPPSISFSTHPTSPNHVLVLFIN